MKRNGIWHPDPPALSDKIADWQSLGDAGGSSLIVDKDVLDLGPEFAVDALVLAPAAKSYTVVDTSEPILEHAKRVAPQVRPEAFDLTKPWPFAAESFDTILDFSTLDDTGAAEHGYREVARVLRIGGHFVTTYANARAAAATASNAKDPSAVKSLLESHNLIVVLDGRHDQPRAAMAVIKVADARRAVPDSLGDEALLEWTLSFVPLEHRETVAFTLRREIGRRTPR